MNNEHQDDLRRATLTIAEVAARLGVPEPTVRGWIRRKVLPSIRIGGRRLVRVTDLDAVVNAAQASTPPSDVATVAPGARSPPRRA